MYQKDIVYGRTHGAGLLADIASPDQVGPLPVILSVHGGRWIREDRYTQSSIDVEQWASFGFFAMNIEYRLLTCSPPPACYQDVQCAIRWVHAHADQYHLDVSRLFLIGMSAGGHMVSLAATLGDGNYPRTGGWEDAPNTITAAISCSGAYDLPKLPWGNAWLQLGVPWDKSMRDASPIQHIRPDMPPLMMLHSDNDPSVPIDQAERMAKALERAGARFVFRHYRDQGHIPINDMVVTEARQFIDQICRDAPGR